MTQAIQTARMALGAFSEMKEKGFELSAMTYSLLESLIARDGYASLVYAKGNNQRFELGEPEIAKDPELSYIYATITGAFPLGEPEMAKDSHWGCLYAIDVLNDRFPLAEPEIAKSEEYSKMYLEVFGIDIRKS